MQNSTYSRLMSGNPDYDPSSDPPSKFEIHSKEQNQSNKMVSGLVDGIRWDFSTYGGYELIFHAHPWENPIVFEFGIAGGAHFKGNEEIAVRFYHKFHLHDLILALKLTFKDDTYVIRRVLWDDETGSVRWVSCSVDNIEFQINYGNEVESPNEIHVRIYDWNHRREEVLQEIRMRNVHDQ